MTRIEKIANSLAGNYADRQDVYQEGCIEVLHMRDEQTESYYATGAQFRIRNYLRKERKHQGREGHLLDNVIENISDGSLPYGVKRTIPHHNEKIDDGGIDNSEGDKQFRKLSDKTVAKIRNEYIPYVISLKMLAIKYHVSKRVISNIIKGDTYAL